MAKTDKILISILCLSVSVVLSQDVEVNGNCSLTSPPEPFTVTGVSRDALSCQLLGTSSCNNGHLPPQVGGPFMGPPASLELEGVLVAHRETFYPQLKVTWEPPKSAAGISELKGFYMEFHRVLGPPSTKMPEFMCRVFDLSESNFTAGDHKLKFQKTFVQFPGGKEYLYILDLYTLPLSSDSEKIRKYFSLQASINENNTANWVAAMSYSAENGTAPAKISVKFSLAPGFFEFKKYLLQLVSKADDKNALISCNVNVAEDYECQGKMYSPPAPDATMFQHTFLDVPAGTYKVWVQPVDPYWQQDGRCLCFVDDGGRRCKRCMTTETSEFVVEGEVVPPQTSPTPTTKGPETPKTSMATVTDDSQTPAVEEISAPTDHENKTMLALASVFGVVIGIILVAIVGVCFWRQRRTGGARLPFFRPNNEDKTPPLDLPKKKVCIVHASDHKEHLNVIDKFARYLNDHCSCIVYYMPWFQAEIRTVGCYEWVIKHINMADYVLIINSEAAFRLYEARNQNMSFRMEDRGPEEDMFSLAISHVMARSNHTDFYKTNILTYFEYTSEEFLLKDFGPGIQYKLPKHMKELLCHIHEVETYSIDPRQFTINTFADVQAKPEGRSLLEAITKAKHFQKSNPYWFPKNFHRQDSAYDSASSHMDEPDSVSTSPRYLPNLQPFESTDETKSTVTYDTSYLKGQDGHLDDASSAVTYDTHYQNMHPEGGFWPAAPSTVVTTAAPTEVINQQIADINRQRMNNLSESFQSPLMGEVSPSDFYPPSDVMDDVDINLKLLNINRRMDQEGYQNLDPEGHHNLDPEGYQYLNSQCYQNLDQTGHHNLDPSGRQNIPGDSGEGEDSDSSAGRDV